MASQENPKGQNKSLQVMLIVGLVVIVVLLGVIILLLVRKQQTPEEGKRNVVVTQDNAESVAEELINQEYVEPGYYSTQMSTTWHFKDGKSASDDAYVKNDQANTNDVYFDVFLEEDESEAIYQSPVIPRGGELEGITLDKELKAGTYNCVMVYHLVDDNQETISTLRVAFTVVVEN